MDKKIKKIEKDEKKAMMSEKKVGSGLKSLLKADKKQDKKMDKCEMKMKKK